MSETEFPLPPDLAHNDDSRAYFWRGYFTGAASAVFFGLIGCGLYAILH